MEFALRPGKSIRRELKRIARKELGRASARLRDADGVDAVHSARQSVKKVEAVAKLLDETGIVPPRKDIARLRTTRRTLSMLRDATAIISTFTSLHSRFPHRIPEHTSGIIRKHLTRRQLKMVRRAASGAGRIVRARKVLRKIRRSVKHWEMPSIDVSELPQILKRSFRVSRKAMKRAEARRQARDFHRWRKRVKDLWYQLRLAERLVVGLSEQVAEFKELETALGEEHDLMVLRHHLTRDRGLSRIRSHIEALAAMSSALQEELRRAALVLGARLYALSPKKFSKDLRRRLKPEGTPRRTPSPLTRGRAVT